MTSKFLIDNVPKYFCLRDLKRILDTTNNNKFNIFKIVDSHSKMSERKFLFVNSHENILEGVVETGQSLPIKIKKVESIDFNTEKIPIDEDKTLFLSNFFANTRLTEFSKLFSKYQLRKSLLVSPIQFSSNSKFVIVRFETEADAFSAYRELDGLLVKDMFNGKLIKRLKADLY